MSNFSTKNVVVEEEKKSVSKFLSYGVQEAAIIGYELKTAQSGKQQVILLMESPKVQDAGFEPDPSAKFGGKVGRVQATIYFGPEDKARVDEFIQFVAIIAKKLGVTEKVDAIESSNLEDYLNKLMPLIRGKYAWWGIAAEEYINKDNQVRYSLKFRRYGFMASLDEMKANPEHIKPFDKTSPYDYKAVAVPSADPDFKTQEPEDEMPW